MNKFPRAVLNYALAVYRESIFVIGGLMHIGDANWVGVKNVWCAYVYTVIAPECEDEQDLTYLPLKASLMEER